MFKKRLFSGLGAITASSTALAEDAQRWGVNMTEGVTDVSREIYGLHMDIFWWCVGIGVVVFGVMFYSMFKHRRSVRKESATFHENTLLEIIWTVIPVIILVIMAIPATTTLERIYDTADADIDIQVTGYQWKWRYEYMGEDLSFFSNLRTSQDEITGRSQKGEHYLLEVDEPLVVPTGQKIRFIINAADVIHAWWVPALAVKKDAIPGYNNEAWTTINEPGIYRGQCAELCGRDHGFMPIVVHAMEPADYERWLADKREEAAVLRELMAQTFTFEELMTRGEGVYQRMCVACHGANGEGGVGKAIAGSPVATGDINAHLDLLVNGVNGTAMQAFGEQLNDLDMAAVLTYTRTAFGNNMGDSLQAVDVYQFKAAQ
ncbi:MAG: cytochrome c oxidase subunit II [Gammaproteobacteria bacterium]|nr:cytochrome c oxidase subunit II [Gammaproteobacteria bacterium]